MQQVTFVFRPVGGGVSFSRTQYVFPNRAFHLSGIPAGNYTLWIKGETYLARVVSADASGGEVSGVTATLLPGDASGNNTVDLADFNLDTLAYFYGSTNYDWQTGYYFLLDFNGDGSIDLGDFGLFINSFGMNGDL